jgi:hypothetical protein
MSLLVLDQLTSLGALVSRTSHCRYERIPLYRRDGCDIREPGPPLCRQHNGWHGTPATTEPLADLERLMLRLESMSRSRSGRPSS